MYRRPDKTRAPYELALRLAHRRFTKHRIAALLDGDLNITAWNKVYRERADHNGLWVLPNPSAPTYTAGSATDTILIAGGNYPPEGMLPN